jgi:hypothetical protein
MPQEPFFMEIYKANAVRVDRGHCFARACAIEMHMDMSQEPFCVEFRGKMPDAPDNTSIKYRALTLTVKAP